MLAAAMLAGVGGANAQLEIVGTIQNGGGAIASGTFELDAAIADPFATSAVESGTFELTGGIESPEEPPTAVDDWTVLDN